MKNKESIHLYYADCRGEDVQARIDKGSGRRVSPYYLFNVAADDAFNITRVWNQPYIVIHQANKMCIRDRNRNVSAGIIKRDSPRRMVESH